VNEQGNIVGNVYDKYGTRNPVARYLMQGFLDAVAKLYLETKASSVLEVGCGEGSLANYLIQNAHRPNRLDACDLSLDRVREDIDPFIKMREASIYELPYQDKSFDLVICCEVLEHLENPDKGLNELARVARNHVILSTPREPIWRLLNMARGKYLRNLGNTPGHIQHFSKSELIHLANTNLSMKKVLTPLPWTILLGTPNTQ
jgi:ubiquinone/menaquinone biosynthesis C-methylase UbiE